jgi:hypothetical protein
MRRGGDFARDDQEPASEDEHRGGQGRVKNPLSDGRLLANGGGQRGQGRVKDASKDRRFAKNRNGPTGQGRVKNPASDGRLVANRFRANGPLEAESLAIEQAAPPEQEDAV